MLVAEESLIDKFVIGRLGERVFEALAGIAEVPEKKALGLIEILYGGQCDFGGGRGGKGGGYSPD